MIQQLPINLWLFFFWLNIIKKCNFYELFFFFILKVYLGFQFCYFVISTPLRIALQWPRLPDLFQGQVCGKPTRGCRRLRWQCRSPAAVNWIHSSLPPSLPPPLCKEREELPCLTGAEGGSIQKALSPF